MDLNKKEISEYILKCNQEKNTEGQVMACIMQKSQQGSSYSADVIFDQRKTSWMLFPKQCETNIGYLKYTFYIESELPNETLKEFLKENIPFNKFDRMRFGAVTEDVTIILKEVAEGFQYTLEFTKVETHIFYLDKNNYNSNLSKQDLPPNFSFRELTASDAPHVANQWLYTDKGDADFQQTQITKQMEHFIAVNRSVGLTCCDSRGQDVLVGAVLEDYFGAIGRLYVLPEYRGEGFGFLLVRELLRIMFEDLDTVFACITTGNLQSRHIFSKLGFQMLPSRRCWYECFKM